MAFETIQNLLGGVRKKISDYNEKMNGRQPVISRIFFLLILMVTFGYCLNWAYFTIMEDNMWWQLDAIITLYFFYTQRKVFHEEIGEKTTLLVVNDWFGDFFGERPAASGPSVILLFPWESVKADNVFTEETFSTGDISETVPGEDNMRAIVRGYITASLSREGSRAYNQLGPTAKQQVLSYLDGLFREYVSSTVIADENAKGLEKFHPIPELISRKAKISKEFKDFLEEKAGEMFVKYGVRVRDCKIKEIDFDEKSNDLRLNRAQRSQTIDGDNELMTQVFRIVREQYGEELTADQKRDAVDSVMAGMSATGENVTNRITSIAGVNTSEIVQAVLDFLKNQKK